VYPILKYRVLWTWDYCMGWDHTVFARGRGAFGPNQRRAAFLSDYLRMVDFCAKQNINGIVIWGALRAHNGGEEQLRELANYGNERGVRILPGVGIFGYGGIYYDPRADYDSVVDTPLTPHPYSLTSWLTDHPELAAIGPDGKPYRTGPYSSLACPSKPENLAWFREALAWLYSEFPIGGVQVEVGDYSICHCDDCRVRRAYNLDAMFAVEDMRLAYGEAVSVAQGIRPDTWVICETYSSPGIAMHAEEPGFNKVMSLRQKELLSTLPEGTILQWVADRAVGPNADHRWPSNTYLPVRENIARIHAGSQWSGGGCDEWAVETISDLVERSAAGNMHGVSIFGEESPVAPPNEANYLAFGQLAGRDWTERQPVSMSQFYTQVLDPLYGGADMAAAWRNLYTSARELRARRSANAAAKLVRLADQVHSTSAKLSGETCRRWSWLEDWIWKAEWLCRTQPRRA